MNYFDSVVRDYIDNASFKAKKVSVLIIDDGDKDLSLQRDLQKLYEITTMTMNSDGNYTEIIMKERFDIIFVDYSAKTKDFMEIAEDIRRIGSISVAFESYATSVPIIVIIGKNASGNKKVVLGELIDDFVVKPMEVFYLDRLLRKWLPANKRTKKEEKVQKEEEDSNSGDKIEIIGLDMNYLYKSSGYDKRALLQKLSMFYKQGVQKAEELSEYINKGDYANYIEQMKYMKVFAKEYGAHSLYELAKVQQIAGLAGNYDFIEERFPNIYESLNSIITGIENYLKSGVKEKKKNKKLPITEYEAKNEMLVALSYLDNIMPNAAASVLGKLLSCQLPKDLEIAVISTTDYIEEMEYEKAMLLLKSCLVN